MDLCSPNLPDSSPTTQYILGRLEASSIRVQADVNSLRAAFEGLPAAIRDELRRELDMVMVPLTARVTKLEAQANDDHNTILKWKTLVAFTVAALVAGFYFIVYFVKYPRLGG